MSADRIPHEWQADDHSTLKVEHRDDGQVWLSVIPSRDYKMLVDRKRVGGIAFPLRPDLASSIGQGLLDEAQKATQQGEASAG